MANEIIRPSELPLRSDPVASEVVPSDNGSTVAGVTWEDGVNAAVPVASQAEAEAGVDNSKRMTPLTSKQAVDYQVGPKISTAIGDLNLGSASQASVEDFATAAQGENADSALQPADIGATVQGHGAFLDALAGMTPGSNGQVIGFDADGNPAPISAGAGDLVAANNLSDVDSPVLSLGNLGVVRFNTVQNLLADTLMSYADDPGKIQVGPGDVIEASGFRYEVAASDATGAHVETTGGVKLRPTGPILYPQMFGAMGDATGDVGVGTDDTAAIQAACDLAGEIVSDGKIVSVHLNSPHGRGFRTTDTILVPNGVAWWQEDDTTIYYDGPRDRPAIYHKGGRTLMLRFLVFSTVIDWGTEDFVGVALENVTFSDIYLSLINSFAVNFQLIADDFGVVFNRIFPSALQSAKVQMDWVSRNDGWVNSNVSIGGAMRNFASTIGFGPRVGWRLRSEYGYENNNNVVRDISAEIVRSSGDDGVYWQCIDGRLNKAINWRGETSGSGSAVALEQHNNSRNNDISEMFGYLSGGVTPSVNLGTKGVATSSNNPDSPYQSDPQRKLLFSSGLMNRITVQYSGGTSYNIAGCHILRNDASVRPGDTNIERLSGHIRIGSGRAVGVYVDASVVKRFALYKSVPDGLAGGRTLVQAFDANMNTLFSVGIPRVMSIGNPAFTPNSGWGGWITGSDTVSGNAFEVDDDVKIVGIYIARQSADAFIRSFSIEAIGTDADVAVWTSWEPPFPGSNLVTAQPTDTDYPAGRTVFSTSGGGFVFDGTSWGTL